MEKSFSLKFLEESPCVDFDIEWAWKPKHEMSHLDAIKTATFGSGRNQAEDWTNE